MKKERADGEAFPCKYDLPKSSCRCRIVWSEFVYAIDRHASELFTWFLRTCDQGSEQFFAVFRLDTVHDAFVESRQINICVRITVRQDSRLEHCVRSLSSVLFEGVHL